MLNNKDFNKKFGERVRFFRAQAKMTQEQLSEKLNLQPSTLSYIESGKNNISFMKLPALCEALNIKPHQLFLFDNRFDNDIVRINDIVSILGSVDEKQLELIHRVVFDIASYTQSR